ncbi:MAG: nucleotide exchange factor GrpE [Acidobacteriota bacterium]
MAKIDKEKSAKIEKRSIMEFDRRADSVSTDDRANSNASEDQSAESEASIEDTLKKERDEYYDLLLRKQAEFENYRKRVMREQEEVRNNVRADVIAELLPVVDSCEKGLQVMQEQTVPEPCRTYVDGYALLKSCFAHPRSRWLCLRTSPDRRTLDLGHSGDLGSRGLTFETRLL